MCVTYDMYFNMCLSLQVPLGHYPHEHFSEKTPCEHMETFKVELRYLSDKIHLRNKFLTSTPKIPYTFLDPLLVENSVAI